MSSIAYDPSRYVRYVSLDFTFFHACDNVSNVGKALAEQAGVGFHLDALAQELALGGHSASRAARQMIAPGRCAL